MKKFLLLLALTLFAAVQMLAQEAFPGGFGHIIEVGRYSNYGRGFLTITDPNVIKIDVEHTGNLFDFPITYEYVNENTEKLQANQLIVEVDGVSAEGWTKEQFYQKVDNRTDEISLKIRRRSSSAGIYDYETKIRPVYELPENLQIFGSSLSWRGGETFGHKRKRMRGNGGLTKDTVFEVWRDDNFDFFPCLSYDFRLTDSNRKLDKEILQKIGLGFFWSGRNKENPDILVTISESVVEKGNTVDLFLEITALDAKTAVSPVPVWRATAKRHVVNPNFTYSQELAALASWMAVPFDDRWVNNDTFKIYAPVGVTYDPSDHMVVTAVKKGSRAEKLGILPGDKLLKAVVPYDSDATSTINSKLKKNGWGALSNYLNKAIDVTVLRNGEKLKFEFRPRSLTLKHFFWVGAE
ncbi:MAG: hypothetical protein J5764_03305 [Bacteroidales bacterium]|nr:hypothetical protein [Bacteroidales bacterium]